VYKTVFLPNLPFSCAKQDVMRQRERRKINEECDRKWVGSSERERR
jgi:hypothetical protein